MAKNKYKKCEKCEIFLNVTPVYKYNSKFLGIFKNSKGKEFKKYLTTKTWLKDRPALCNENIINNKRCDSCTKTYA